MKTTKLNLFKLFLTAVILLTISAVNVSAHCDGLDGPVVKAARKALETNNVNLVLIWVNGNDEAAIKEAFSKTMAVRNVNKEVQELADYYFFETLVRLHRAGEGEPYTGLKPAGRDLGPVIPAADLSIEKKSFEPISNLFNKANLPTEQIRKLFEDVQQSKNYEPNNVEAGRKYVKAYIAFLHFAEENYESALKHQNEKGVSKMKITIPEPLKLEHEELHAQLLKATKEYGEVGIAAKNIAKILHNHFVKEEEYAIPPLGLLSEISKGNVTTEMKPVLAMTDKLKKELPEMLNEHKMIVEALDKLASIAKKENKPEYVEFAEKLKLHAQTEEEVMYPASLLVGELVKMKFPN